MINNQIIIKKKRELEQCNKFRENIPLMKANFNLSDEWVNEILTRIDLKISECKIIIQENTQKSLNNQKLESNTSSQKKVIVSY